MTTPRARPGKASGRPPEHEAGGARRATGAADPSSIGRVACGSFISLSSSGTARRASREAHGCQLSAGGAGRRPRRGSALSPRRGRSLRRIATVASCRICSSWLICGAIFLVPQCAMAPPVPVPNTVVKRRSADTTAGATRWDDRPAPGIQPRPPAMGALFCICGTASACAILAIAYGSLGVANTGAVRDQPTPCREESAYARRRTSCAGTPGRGS